MINTQMNITNDNTINIRSSTPRNNTLHVTQPDTIPNVFQNTPTSKTIIAIKNTPPTREDTNEDPNIQETANSITENGDDDI